MFTVTSGPAFYCTVITSNLLLSAIRGLHNEGLYQHRNGYADTGLAASTPVVSDTSNHLRGEADVGLLATQDRAVASSLGHIVQINRVRLVSQAVFFDRERNR